MSVIKITEARSKLYKLVEDANKNHKPVTITGKKGNAVLISEEDWNAIQETLFLMSIPGMRESIIEGLKTSDEECNETLNW